MGKRKYRSVLVKEVVVARVVEQLVEGRVVFAVDVAKEWMYGALMESGHSVLKTIRWSHPTETPDVVSLLGELRSAGVDVTVAMEPSGTYGDALRWRFQRSGFSVHRVNPKRSHDAAEVYDGVPSWHDAKCAAIIGKLHLDGLSEPWPAKTDGRRRLEALLRELEVWEKQFESNRNRLEGLLARHWPELVNELALDSATLLELLCAFGGPAAVAARPSAAARLMRRVGGAYLLDDKIERVVKSAGSTLGVCALDAEEALLRCIASEARRNQKQAQRARRAVEKQTGEEPCAKHMAPTIGKTTAAVMVATLGNPSDYGSAKAFEKALGLNLREKSSGKQQERGLHITKRGPCVVRMHLYFAVLRLLQGDPVVAAWYARKVKRDGGKAKTKAVVALMRKLARALWHVSRGQAFDASKLFDTRRLDLKLTRAA